MKTATHRIPSAHRSFLILGLLLATAAFGAEKPPAAKLVHVVIHFTVDSDGVPRNIEFVKPVPKEYEQAVRASVSKWHLPKAYAGKRVEQPFDFFIEPEKEKSPSPASPVPVTEPHLKP